MPSAILLDTGVVAAMLVAKYAPGKHSRKALYTRVLQDVEARLDLLDSRVAALSTLTLEIELVRALINEYLKLPHISPEDYAVLKNTIQVVSDYFKALEDIGKAIIVPYDNTHVLSTAKRLYQKHHRQLQNQYKVRLGSQDFIIISTAVHLTQSHGTVELWALDKSLYKALQILQQQEPALKLIKTKLYKQ